jgi:hypothetical protein
MINSPRTTLALVIAPPVDVEADEKRRMTAVEANEGSVKR